MNAAGARARWSRSTARRSRASFVESELFGYEKGAHSTAQGRKSGFIEAAQGGTLFLDELAEMPTELQSKLCGSCRIASSPRSVRTRVQEADVRIIAASSRTAMANKTGAPGVNVQAHCWDGWARIRSSCRRYASGSRTWAAWPAYFLRGTDRAFETEAFHALCLHDWPHNVRELQKVIAEAKLLSAGAPAISFEHCRPASPRWSKAAGDIAGAGGEGPRPTAWCATRSIRR